MRKDAPINLTTKSIKISTLEQIYKVGKLLTLNEEKQICF